jgi:hypothetical protein
MATSPNFGWLEPDNTDLVKNGALAIRTLGDAIDASLVDLKGGTTGQVLAKATNTDMDFTWTTPANGVGAWTTFTPTLNGVTIGNGTVVARYQTIGKTVNVFYKLTFGSTTSVTGTPNLNTPTTAAQTQFIDGGSLMQDTGSAVYMGQVFYTAGAAYPQAMATNATYASTVSLSSTIPHTWANTDILTIVFSYEEA